MKEIILARTAGFCFGVARAVSVCNNLLDNEVSVATLGDIIHNPYVVKEMADRGVVSVKRVSDTPQGSTLVIRSHGAGRSVYEECRQRNIAVADATCPDVAKIHTLVRQYGDEGYTVLIAGDRDHPEVQGIIGHCTGSVHAFEGLPELLDLRTVLEGERCVFVAQTTFNSKQYDVCTQAAKKLWTNIVIFDTICSATRARQREAEKLALECDVCVVIGGQDSSNTKKLCETCAASTLTFWVQSAAELKKEMLSGARTIGVTAGASTPACLIEEVLHRMEEMIKADEMAAENEERLDVHDAAKIQNEVGDDEFNFEQELEHSLRLVRRGQRVTGIVTAIRPNEVVVDIGSKHTGFIPVDELSDDVTAKPEDVVQIGDKVNLIVTKVQDMEGVVTLSKKRVDSDTAIEDLAKGVEEGTVFDAYVTEVVNKGLVAMVKGMRVFIPASQATLRRGEPYEQLVRTHQKIKILEVAAQRRRAIGSIRAVLDDLNEQRRQEVWKNIEEGKRYKGVVKSLTTYGAFVDLGGVDGMIHRSDLSWTRVAKPSDVVSIGDEVEVYVKAVDREAKRISLGYRDEADNPWNQVRQHSVGEEFEGPVVSVTPFGAFVRILPNIDGLVHVSEMAAVSVQNPHALVKTGDVVKVRLIGVDEERKRISLSMKPEGEEEEVLPMLRKDPDENQSISASAEMPPTTDEESCAAVQNPESEDGLAD